MDEDIVNYIGINMYQCNNLTSAGKCKSAEAINAFFQDPLLPKFVGVFFHNTEIDYYDYENPFKITYRLDLITIDPNFRKRTMLYLQTAQVTTDDGVLFSSLNTISNIMFQSKENDFLTRSNPLDPYAQIMFFASKEEVKCSRKYQKLPEILGSLTGMTHLIMFFCMLISNLATYLSTLETLSNHLYVFPAKKKNKSSNTLDIVNIARKMQDLEKLKILLLNEDQLVLFNYLSKPSINFVDNEHNNNQEKKFNKSQMNMSKLMDFSNNRKTGRKIEECFKRIHEGTSKDPINLKLTQLLDKKMCSSRKF